MLVHYEKFPCKQHCIQDDLNDSKIRRNLKYENHLHHILTDTGVSFVETDIKYIVGWLVMTDGYGMKTYCLVTALMV